MVSSNARSISSKELDAAVALHQHDLLDRMMNAVLKVRERLERTSRCLAKANVPYAIIGGNAVAAWVATVDPGAVRNTRDVDILLRRTDFAMAVDAMATEGFVPEEVGNVTLFLDGSDGLPSQGVHVLWADEKVRPNYESSTPSIESVRLIENMRIVELEELVRMKLNAFRDKDKVHIRDFMSVGLVDASWLCRFAPSLAARLQSVLENPDG